MRSIVQDDIQDRIERFGRSVISVFGIPGELTFSYTIGNHGAGLPELILFGVNPRMATAILNDVSERQFKASKPHDDGLLDLGGQFPVLIRNCGPKVDQYIIQARAFYGGAQIAAQQIIMCDPAGKYPGEEGCDPMYARQPMLGKTGN